MNESGDRMEQSTWKQTEEGSWLMMFDTDEKEKEKEKTSSLSEKSLKEFTKLVRKVNKLGTLVMTPQGIGTLIKAENKMCTVRFVKEEVELTFEEKSVDSEFSIYIKLFDDNLVNCFRLVLPSTGDISALKTMMERLKIFNSEGYDFDLIYAGIELSDDMTYLQLNMKSGDVILLLKGGKCEYKLTRFTEMKEYWFCNPDAIVFSVNRKITLTGIGFYISNEGQSQDFIISIFEVEGEATRDSRRGRSQGGHIAGNTTDPNYSQYLLYEQKALIPETSSTNDSKCKVALEKSIKIKPNSNYKIGIFYTGNNTSEILYGINGTANISGERNVEFVFKKSQYDSSHSQGNFPDLYYYV